LDSLLGLVSCAGGGTNARVYRTWNQGELEAIGETVLQGCRGGLFSFDAELDGDVVEFTVAGFSHKRRLLLESRYLPTAKDGPELDLLVIGGSARVGLFGDREGFYLYAIHKSEDGPPAFHASEDEPPSKPPVAAGLIISNERGQDYLFDEDIETEALRNVDVIQRVREFRIVPESVVRLGANDTPARP